MKGFLNEVAQDIINNQKENLSEICFVFPNKRTGFYFRKCLSEMIGKTVWSPDIYTIQSFIRKFTDRLNFFYKPIKRTLFPLFRCTKIEMS